MFSAQPLLTQRVLRVQGMLAPVFGLAGLLWAGSGAAVAALYGAGIAFAVTALLVWRETQCARHPEWDQQKLMKRFIGVGVERLVLLSALLAVGFGVLELAPLPLLLGLVGAQFAWFALALVARPVGKSADKK
jgi:ATP synthase protein I